MSWIGAIGAFLAVALSGIIAGGVEELRAAYIALDWIALFVILPLAAASLPTGVAISLMTSWGLARHYWIIVKIGINVAALALLILHLGPIHEAARRALLAAFDSTDVAGAQVQFAVQVGAAIIVLLGAVALSIYKPKGVTARGRRFQLERPSIAGGGAWPHRKRSRPARSCHCYRRSSSWISVGSWSPSSDARMYRPSPAE